MRKAKFKKNDVFFHPEQKLFVMIDDVQFFDKTNKNGDKGWLYTLKCFKHEKDEAKPWKRYYESRIINELLPLKSSNTMKVLYGDSNV